MEQAYVEIRERLTRVEAGVDQLRRMFEEHTELMERLVRIEEQREFDSTAIRRLHQRVESVEKALEGVAQLRRMTGWALTLASSLTVAVVVRIAAELMR